MREREGEVGDATKKRSWAGNERDEGRHKENFRLMLPNF